jgi:threonine dehydrogenase-like Zn-dependent dehydrogenase
MHAFERLGAVRSHETVLIQGSGPLGIFGVAVARAQGAKRVLIVGAPVGRLEIAREMGADDVLDLDEAPTEDDRIAWVRDRTAGRGADIVIQAATARAVPEGLQMLRDGGRFASVGVGEGAAMPTDRLPGEMTLHTVRSGEPRHWLQAIDFLESRWHDYPFEHMISATYGLDQIDAAMTAMAQFSVVKAAIYPNGSAPV